MTFKLGNTFSIRLVLPRMEMWGATLSKYLLKQSFKGGKCYFVSSNLTIRYRKLLINTKIILHFPLFCKLRLDYLISILRRNN